MSSPETARGGGEEPTPWPRDYGHLQRLAARYAQARLAGHAVVNGASEQTIRFDWPHGLRSAVAPGTAPELLLAVPSLPSLLANARPLGASDDPKRRHDVRRVHGFAASVEVTGRPIALWLIAREDKRGELAFDGVVPRSPLVAPREDGGDLPDLPGARSRALQKVLARIRPMHRQDGGEASDDAGSNTISAEPDSDGGESTESESDSGESPLENSDGSPPSTEVEASLEFPEEHPSSDVQEGWRHGYSIDEWRALQHSSAQQPTQQSQPTYFNRVTHGLVKDAEQAFGGDYGLSPSVYEWLGGDRAVLTRWIYQPIAKAAELLGDPKRGPAFALSLLTRPIAEIANTTPEDSDRAKGELDELAGLTSLAAAIHDPEMPAPLRGSDAEPAELSHGPSSTSGAAEESASPQSQSTIKVDGNGQFSIWDWTGYPEGIPRPKGPFRLIDGAEYNNAKKLANTFRKQFRDELTENEVDLDGKEVHHIQPIKFGGAPADPENVMLMTKEQHRQVSRWWEKRQSEFQKLQASNGS